VFGPAVPVPAFTRTPPCAHPSSIAVLSIPVADTLP